MTFLLSFQRSFSLHLFLSSAIWVYQIFLPLSTFFWHFFYFFYFAFFLLNKGKIGNFIWISFYVVFHNTFYILHHFECKCKYKFYFFSFLLFFFKFILFLLLFTTRLSFYNNLNQNASKNLKKIDFFYYMLYLNKNNPF